MRNKSEIILYASPDGQVRLEVRLEDETVWLTQKMMADLFQVTVPTVNEHIKNILEEGELAPQATIRKFRIVQKEGVREVSRHVDFFNLEMILAVGYRVRIVEMYLDYAEDQAKRHRQIFMRDWRKKLDAFLKFNERDILEHAGTVTKKVADALALEQFEVFHQHRLQIEAETERLADDEILKAIEKKAIKLLKKKTRKT